MLVLSRQKDETIMIGDDVEITIVDIKGERVRVGIKAPTRIAVHRKEVYDAIKAEREADDRRHGPTHQCDTSCPPHTKPAPPVKNTRDNKPPKGSFCSPPSSSAVAAA